MIRSDIRALSAYHVPDSSGMIKLDAMENPYRLPAELRRKWGAFLAKTEINRYPDAEMLDLRTKIAEQEGLDPAQVLIGNGSDEIIQMILMAADPGACVTPAPTFVMYELISRWLKRPVSTVPLSASFDIDADKFLQVCTHEKASLIFLACPNNPTGNLWPETTVRQIAENFRGLVIIDEAYAPFANRTHTGLIAPNVLVLRTFSKLGWAGLRLGYLLGDAKTIAHLNKVRLPYNINALTQASAMFLLDHGEVFEEQARAIREERARMARELKKMDGIEVFPSDANFLLARVRDANATFEALKERKILIKNMHPQGGLLSQCIRITIGSEKENDALLTAIKECL
jgi:histidinol-phosphate aminotransferase